MICRSAGKTAAASSQPMPAANGASGPVAAPAEPAAAAAAAPTGRKRSSEDAPRHQSSPSRQQDEGYRDRKRSRSREVPHRQPSGRRYEDRGDRYEDRGGHRRHERDSGYREPGHRGGRYGDSHMPNRHWPGDNGRGNGARGGPATHSGRGRYELTMSLNHCPAAPTAITY